LFRERARETRLLKTKKHPSTMTTSVAEILSYDKAAQDDYYGLLGCDQTSTVSTTTYAVARIVLRA